MKQIIIFTLTLILVGCSKKESIIQKYDNGQPKVVYEILKGTLENPVDFMYKAYYDNGVLMKEGLMKNMKEEGEWKFYFDDGKVNSVGNFKDGVRIGKFVRYYQTGQIEQEGSYENGEIRKSAFFYRNGTIKKSDIKPAEFVKESCSPWSAFEKKKIISRCNQVLQFDFKNANIFCSCIIDSVSSHVEFNAIDTLSDYDKSLIYRLLMHNGACEDILSK
jgi:hypothetical protein